MKEENLFKQFKLDVQTGLTAESKYLHSKYIYDENGDKLFQQIMAMPEYYLTRCEYQILQTYKTEITQAFNGKKGFDLIELGAGDAKKTKVLLKHWLQQNLEFKYVPIDISQHALQSLLSSLSKEFPKLKIEPKQGTYMQVLKKLSEFNLRKKIILVLGSNIGNLRNNEAINFLKNIQASMNTEDLLFVGFDQKKEPDIILNAYHDSTGITEAFNKNILKRINKELEANFVLKDFVYWPTYDPESGMLKSFLVSTKNQEVSLEKLQLKIKLKKNETIHTEISQKYDDAHVNWLASEAGLELIRDFADQKQYYKNYIFRKIKEK